MLDLPTKDISRYQQKLWPSSRGTNSTVVMENGYAAVIQSLNHF